jgi:hypothetical protein
MRYDVRVPVDLPKRKVHVEGRCLSVDTFAISTSIVLAYGK